MAPAQAIDPSDHVVILTSYESDYRQSKGSDRQEVLQNIVAEIVAQYEVAPRESATKDLTRRIRVWYGNHKAVQVEDEPALVRVGIVWNYRLVIQNLFKDQIAKELETYNLTPTSKDRMQKFQWSTNAVMKTLGDEAVKKYAAVAKAWNETEAPEEVKRRVATNRSGPAINSFLKKMQETMGVAMVGVAAYRDDTGKLCTYDFCTKDSRQTTFSQVYSKDIEQLHAKWGKWVSKKGVGNIEPNEGSDEDTEPEELANSAWMRLLELDNGVYSLKPLEDVEANKVNLGIALRHIMRQAWEQSGRKGKISWGVIDRKPLDMIHSRFILKSKIGNPTRMGRVEVEEYWQAWVTLQTKGDPFSFVSYGKGKGREEEEEEGEEEGEKGDGGDKGQDGDQEEGCHSKTNKKHPSPTPGFAVDKDIPLPCECTTPAMRTICLQQLAPKWGSSRAVYCTIVQLVDTLEDTNTPSGFENSEWPFIQWSWDNVHLSAEVHADRDSLEGFLEWLDKETSALSEEKSLNKNQIQELLLGMGLYLRDYEFACFADVNEIVLPGFVAASEMKASDDTTINRILRSFSDALRLASGDGPSSPSKKLSKEVKKKVTRSPKKAGRKRKRLPTPPESPVLDSQPEEPRRSKRATKASQKKQAIEKEVEIKRKAKGTQHKK